MALRPPETPRSPTLNIDLVFRADVLHITLITLMLLIFLLCALLASILAGTVIFGAFTALSLSPHRLLLCAFSSIQSKDRCLRFKCMSPCVLIASHLLLEIACHSLLAIMNGPEQSSTKASLTRASSTASTTSQAGPSRNRSKACLHCRWVFCVYLRAEQ